MDRVDKMRRGFYVAHSYHGLTCKRCGVQRRYASSGWEWKETDGAWTSSNPPCARKSTPNVSTRYVAAMETLKNGLKAAGLALGGVQPGASVGHERCGAVCVTVRVRVPAELLEATAKRAK